MTSIFNKVKLSVKSVSLKLISHGSIEEKLNLSSIDNLNRCNEWLQYFPKQTTGNFSFKHTIEKQFFRAILSEKLNNFMDFPVIPKIISEQHYTVFNSWFLILSVFLLVKFFMSHHGDISPWSHRWQKNVKEFIFFLYMTTQQVQI